MLAILCVLLGCALFLAGVALTWLPALGPVAAVMGVGFVAVGLLVDLEGKP